MTAYTRTQGTVEAVQWETTNEVDFKAVLAMFDSKSEDGMESFVKDDVYLVFIDKVMKAVWATDYLVVEAGRAYILSKSQFEQVFVRYPLVVADAEE